MSEQEEGKGLNKIGMLIGIAIAAFGLYVAWFAMQPGKNHAEISLGLIIAIIGFIIIMKSKQQGNDAKDKIKWGKIGFGIIVLIMIIQMVIVKVNKPTKVEHGQYDSGDVLDFYIEKCSEQDTISYSDCMNGVMERIK